MRYGGATKWTGDNLVVSPLVCGALFCALIAGCGPPRSARVVDSRVDSTSQDGAAKVVDALAASPGRKLYLQHCAACHGDHGDGNGVAAKFLFPKPRDFRAGLFRLVSTKNTLPADDDLDSVLRRGMPGSAMPPWPKLTHPERLQLVEEVRRLRRQGLIDRFAAELKEDDPEAPLDEAALAARAAEMTKPDEYVEVAPIGTADEQTVACGRAIYIRQSCHSCHGKEGKGDGQQMMVDREGLPTRPRDLTRGIFKGGHDPASVYRRIAIGMPGSPMPSSKGLLNPQEMMELTHYLLSLSDEPARQAAILNRETIRAPAVSKVPPDANAVEWNSVPAARVRMTPLWWRDDADPDLRVQALHDGQSLAVRLQWRDAQANWHAARTEAFKDLAAMQLYRGTAEPFLGMGSAGAHVDVWTWDADRQSERQDLEDVNPRVVVDLYPLGEQVVDTAEYNRPGTRTANLPEATFPARAVGNQVARGMRTSPASAGGAGLTAGGPGTLTFRIPQSQLVQARGTWVDGEWTVVLLRVLKVNDPQDGVTLEPGAKASVAFAIWDGSHHDRDGQKVISIWQDFVLEAK